MLVWATEIPIKDGATCDDLLELSKLWLTGSPHRHWKKTIFETLPVGELVKYENAGETVELIRFLRNSETWQGFRYNYTDNKLQRWSTEIIGYSTSSGLTVSIQVHCENENPGTPLPKPKKPYLVRQLLEKLGGGIDGVFAVRDRPHILQDKDLGLASTIVNGTAGNRLPIVYASAGWNNRPSFDIETLAKWLSGMAHIVVEPSRFFSYSLSTLVEQSNAYDGAVGVYWPNGIARHIRFFPDRFESRDMLSIAVAEMIRRALTAKRPTEICTWDYVRELVSTQRIDELKKSAADEYVREFDQEINAKNERISRLEGEIARLKGELASENRMYGARSERLLQRGKERELYSGEIYDFLIFGLENSLRSLGDSSRGCHIIKDILDANPSKGLRKHLEESIHSALNRSTEFGKKEQRTLEELGFIINQDGKHIKAVFQGDGRYTFTFPCTPSDFRAMKNNASDIIRLLCK